MAQYKALQQQSHNQAPDHHTSPIPSAVVTLPVPEEVLAQLCYAARYSEDQPAIATEHVRATALSLLHAAQQLEADLEAQQIQLSNQVNGTSSRKFFLKRNYACKEKHLLSCQQDTCSKPVQWCTALRMV